MEHWLRMCYTVNDKWKRVCDMDDNFTYMVRCADGSLYCGWTNHLEERIRAHNEGRGAKYTKSRRPVELVYFETFSTKQDAMRREWEIKHMTRAGKLELIAASGDRESAAGAY